MKSWTQADELDYRRLAAECLTMARQVDSMPCNQDGSDKTWVVKALENALVFFRSAKPATT